MSAVESTSKIKCPRCGASFPIPNLSEEVRKQTAFFFRAGVQLEVVKYLHEKQGIGLEDSKAIIFHITKEKGFCHRCKTKLLSPELSICPKCQSLNLDL
jgi:Zn finger protein HypA/HybF involved in hydrogenase expression